MKRLRAVVVAIIALLTPRALTALGLSTAVTAGVAGPLAVQTLDAQDRLAAATTITTTPALETTVPTTVPPTTEAPPAPSAPSTTTSTTTSTTSTTSTTLPPTTPLTLPPLVTLPPAPSTEGVYVQVDPERNPNQRVRLDNVVRGSVFITYDEPGAVSVAFWLDKDPSGEPTSIDDEAPFDLFPASADGAEPLSTNELADGDHTLVARITFSDGRVEERRTEFTIANAAL